MRRRVRIRRLLTLHPLKRSDPAFSCIPVRKTYVFVRFDAGGFSLRGIATGSVTARAPQRISLYHPAGRCASAGAPFRGHRSTSGRARLPAPAEFPVRLCHSLWPVYACHTGNPAPGSAFSLPPGVYGRVRATLPHHIPPCSAVKYLLQCRKIGYNLPCGANMPVKPFFRLPGCDRRRVFACFRMQGNGAPLNCPWARAAIPR